MDLSAGTSVIGFVDDALLVCAAEDVGILELRVNESLRRAKRWLDNKGLNPEKIEALLVTDKRSFQYSIHLKFKRNLFYNEMKQKKTPYGHDNPLIR